MPDQASYPLEIRHLLIDHHVNALGPGTPNHAVYTALQQLHEDWRISPNIRNRAMASACVAGLWLYHDFFDESHALSQDLHTTEGSYWHGILHRREPDPSNAAYWFRRVGDHPIFEKLAQEALSFGLRLHSPRWSPFEFINLCEAQRGLGTEQEMLLQRVQQREWELLFDWCYRRAATTE